MQPGKAPARRSRSVDRAPGSTTECTVVAAAGASASNAGTANASDAAEHQDVSRVMSRFFRGALVTKGLPSAVLPQDLAPEYFHSKWRAGLYDPPRENSEFGRCERQGHNRILTALPCKYRDRTLLVPFLVDTGCAVTMLHTSAIAKFGFDDTPSTLDIVVAGIALEAQENTLTRCEAGVSDLNILGMDFIKNAAPDVLQYFSESFSKLHPRPRPIWVQVDDRDVLKVAPSENDVFSLKEAVKEKMEKQATGLVVSVSKMKVAKHDGTACDDMGAGLEANTSKTPYQITVAR